MQIEDALQFDGDAIRIKGHRIWIEHILEYYLGGYRPEEIAREFPGLSLERIDASITDYMAHRSDVDAYLIRVDAQKERDYQESLRQPSPLRQRFVALTLQRIDQAMHASPMA